MTSSRSPMATCVSTRCSKNYNNTTKVERKNYGMNECWEKPYKYTHAYYFCLFSRKAENESMASAWEIFVTHESHTGFHNGQASYFNMKILVFAEPGYLQFLKPLLTWVLMKSVVPSATMPMFRVTCSFWALCKDKGMYTSRKLNLLATYFW